jgi:hypothetical protein
MNAEIKPTVSPVKPEPVKPVATAVKPEPVVTVATRQRLDKWGKLRRY